MLALVMLMTLLPPVDGRVVRQFRGGDDPFAPGLRRAVVLDATTAEAVRAPCGGRVLFAGWTPRGRAVTLGCRGQRVTVMPVRSPWAVGGRVRRGAVLGAASGDVSVSVRHGGDYVAPRFVAELGPPPPAPPALAPRRPPPVAEPPPAVFVPPLPWPAWAGVTLLLAAAVRLRVRGRFRTQPAGLGDRTARSA